MPAERQKLSANRRDSFESIQYIFRHITELRKANRELAPLNSDLLPCPTLL